MMQFKWNDTATELPAKELPDGVEGVMGAYPQPDDTPPILFLHVIVDFDDTDPSDPMWVDAETLDCLDPPTAWAYIPQIPTL